MDLFMHRVCMVGCAITAGMIASKQPMLVFVIGGVLTLCIITAKTADQLHTGAQLHQTLLGTCIHMIIQLITRAILYIISIRIGMCFMPLWLSIVANTMACIVIQRYTQ